MGLLDALTDRHDVTEERTQRGFQIGNVDLAETERLLGILAQAVLKQDVSQVIDLVVTDQEIAQEVMTDFPLAGMTRKVVRRTGNGGTMAVVAAFALALPANETRMGMRFVNIGATNAITLILSKDLAADGTPLLAGAPTIGLPAGGAWDGKLGDVLWGGSVMAGGAVSTLTVAEF